MPPINGMITADCKRDNHHRMHTGQNMSGGDFCRRLNRVGFSAELLLVLLFLCCFLFLSCGLFHLLVEVCLRS
jgi:hypothetical protein